MQNTKTLLTHRAEQQRLDLNSATALPNASAFLWNKKMMIQANCRGYAVAQHMQPEPAKYAYAPNLEAKTFMQPEQPYYAHHPGRFFYIKDEDSGELFSAPYEPTRAKQDDFCFSVGKADIQWHIKALGLGIHITLTLPVDDTAELWRFNIINNSERTRKISIYPYFPVGYMSWMNQSAEYNNELGAIVASCVTPYQKVAQYFEHQHFKDLSYLLHSHPPTAWETRQSAFEGEGGLHNPSAIEQQTLSNSDAVYETPTAVLQYSLALTSGQQQAYQFVFGPAKDLSEIVAIKQKYLSENNAIANSHEAYSQYINRHTEQLRITTPDTTFDNFVNDWLARQVFYHGDVNRLTTDPQTRNYLQDAMGMSYLNPSITRKALLLALSQQKSSGAMPDGVLLQEGAELKYINQVPHTDHCVWLPICLEAYLDETNDYALLDEQLSFADSEHSKTVFEHLSLAMEFLMANRDDRGLAYIAQGDWCDPMNMVGYKGKGVSGWLTLAISYALQTWAKIARNAKHSEYSEALESDAHKLNTIANQYFWDGKWYGRGITDDNVLFGISEDKEGRIFLNPQGWALLANAANNQQKADLIEAVEAQLETPYGAMMLAPAYTAMRDDVGRVTQKHPGSAENGSVYNHAAAFYIYGLYQHQQNDKAYSLLRKMLPGPCEADLLQRGQLPNFIPNYYRGAYYQHPRTAGRSSQLFNTGTVHWFYRCIIDGLFGLRGTPEGLSVNPQLPTDWTEASIERTFRGANIQLKIKRDDVKTNTLFIDDVKQEKTVVNNVLADKKYKLTLLIPH